MFITGLDHFLHSNDALNALRALQGRPISRLLGDLLQEIVTLVFCG